MSGGKWYIVPGQRIYADAVMQNRIELDVEQDILEGALAYRLRRKYAKSTQDESNRIWFIVAWHGEHKKELHVRALLIEHDKRLDENKLRKLYQKRWPLLREQINTTRGSWQLDDMTTLETTVKVTNGGYKWDIFISERA
jgi:hypothetical protein